MSDQNNQLATVILAAGKGTRMQSNLPKVLHPVCGKPMIDYVVECAQQLKSNKIVVVVGHQREKVIEHLNQQFSMIDYAVQDPQLGTAHAVRMCQSILGEGKFEGVVLVLSGDVPLIKATSLREMIEHHRKSGAVATLMITQAEDPTGYGRIVRGDDQKLEKIVEEKDIKSDQVRQTKEVNCGIYLFKSSELFETLPRVGNNNQQNEYYLPRVVELYLEDGLEVGTYLNTEMSETHGINNRQQLEEVERKLNKDI